MAPKLPDRIAFVGYARVGKDEAAKSLYPLGYQRSNFGDLIKSELDDLIKRHFRFSAFTEIDQQKQRIRETLQAWGDDNYDRLMRLYFDHLPERVINTRLVRVLEARQWREEGGVLVRVIRPGISPATQWEFRAMQDLEDIIQFDTTVINDGTIEELHRKTLIKLISL